MDKELKPLREAIDKLDVQLLELLNERMRLVEEVARVKADKGLALFDPGREESIYRRLTRMNSGPLSAGSLRAIYREIMAASRILQHPLMIAFVGPEWTYSHLAALSLFGHSARYSPMPVLEDVFDALLKGRAHMAVVPIDNALEGGVGRTIDLLYETDVQVVRECYFEVAHYIGSTLDSAADVKRLYGHPQAIGHCRRWLLENFQHAAWHECTSTALAAQLAKGDPEGAAICNLYAAHHHGLKIIFERIEDHPGNVTRFFALARHANPPTGDDKTSILFAVPDRPGALHAALQPFVNHGLNMTRLESRPTSLLERQYLFCADFEGHCDDEPIKGALGALRERTTFLKVLGSYPKSDPKQPIRIEKEEVRSGGMSAVRSIHETTV